MIKMVELSLLDKIKTLLNLVLSSSLFLILLISIGIIILDISYISRKSKKVKMIYAVISFMIIIGLSINYLKELVNIVNVINKNLVMLINFPTMLEYVTIIFISIIVMIISFIFKRFTKIIRGINLGVVIADIFIFFLILDQVSKTNVDLSNKIDIYSNQNLMVLFQISLFIFIMWMAFLIIYSIIMKLIKSNYNIEKQIIKNEEIKNIDIEENNKFEDLE